MQHYHLLQVFFFIMRIMCIINTKKSVYSHAQPDVRHPSHAEALTQFLYPHIHF